MTVELTRSGAAHAVPGSALDPAPARPWSVYLTFLILVGASIPWRAKSYYTGGVDPVVVAKAALSVLGLGTAYLVGVRRPVLPVQAAPLLFVSAYLACTVLGAWSAGTLIASTIVAVRVMILVSAVLVLRSRFSGPTLVSAMILAMATYGVVGAISGVPSWDGRLGGGFPPLHPNELALFCGVVALFCLAKMTVGREHGRDLVVLGVAVVVLLATQSRTPVAALAVAALLLMVRVQQVRLRTLVLALVVAPVAAAVLIGTGAVVSFLARDQDASQITTLSNRTIAWRAALSPAVEPWTHWLGAGLSTKRIPVPGQFWSQQILDSSWISALVQGGLLGVGVCALWVCHTVVAVNRRTNEGRVLHLAVLAFLVLRSFLESGLFDATTAFLLFFTLTVAPPAPLGAGYESSVDR